MRTIARQKWTLLLFLFLLAATLLAAPDADVVLAVTGDVPKPERYTLAELQKFPESKVTARDHDGTQAEFTGVQVVELLRRAGVALGEKLRGPALANAVVIHAADGYQAVFSLAELDSAMNAQPAVLTWSRNGEPLSAAQGPLRLVVPLDKRQARWVRQVTAIELVSIKRPAITNAISAPISSGR